MVLTRLHALGLNMECVTEQASLPRGMLSWCVYIVLRRVSI